MVGRAKWYDDYFCILVYILFILPLDPYPSAAFTLWLMRLFRPIKGCVETTGRLIQDRRKAFVCRNLAQVCHGGIAPFVPSCLPVPII